MIHTKLKIMYLVLDMDIGGLQRVINLLINGLDKERFTPYLCCLDRGGVFYEEIKNESIKTYILNRKPGLFDRKLFVNLYKAIKSNKIDIIHSNNGCTLYAALAGKLAGVKGIIHTDHGRLVPDRLGAKLEDRFSSILLDKFIGVSDELTEYLNATVKVNKKKLITVINGVDTKRFKSANVTERNRLREKLLLSPHDKIIGAVCRLDPIKNLEFLIRSMKSITKTLPNCKLLIVGDGASKENLEALTKEIDIEKNVKFIGRCNEVEKILPMIDIYVSTSLSEGTSMTILEAMSCGIPIIASKVGGNIRLVDSANGILFPLNDEGAFVNGVIELFNQPDTLISMGKNSRKRIENNFSIEHVIRQYEQLYLSM